MKLNQPKLYQPALKDMEAIKKFLLLHEEANFFFFVMQNQFISLYDNEDWDTIKSKAVFCQIEIQIFK